MLFNKGMPLEISWIIKLQIAHIVLHLSVPIIMHLQRQLFINQLQNPRFVDSLLRDGFFYHIILAILFIWLVFKIKNKKNWVRIMTTILLTAGTLGTVFSFSSPTPVPFLYKSLNVLSWMLALGTVVLLWYSKDSRQYFI